MIKQGNFLGKVVSVTKDDAGEIVSVQLRAAVVGVRDTAPAAFGRWPASRSCGPCQAARSSREAPRCAQQANGPSDRRELDAPASRNRSRAGVSAGRKAVKCPGQDIRWKDAWQGPGETGD